MKNRDYIPKSAYNLLYTVMLLRIAKGYTSAELSFLIGYTGDYIASVESLEVPIYNPYDMRIISKVLDEPSLTGIDLDEETGEKVYVEMHRFVEGNEVYHVSHVLDEQDTMVPSFTLIETIGEHQQTSDLDNTDYQLVRNAVKLLIDAGYFYTSHTNLEIFKRIKKLLPAKTISPFYLEQALIELSTNHITATLERVVVDNKGVSYKEN
jgi:hypothetical protein